MWILARYGHCKTVINPQAGSARVMAATERTHKMAVTTKYCVDTTIVPDPKQVTVFISDSIRTPAASEPVYVSYILPEPCHVSSDLPESCQFTIDLHESSHVTVDLHESSHVTVDLHESSQVTVDRHESSHVTVDLHESNQVTVDLHELSLLNLFLKKKKKKKNLSLYLSLLPLLACTYLNND